MMGLFRQLVLLPLAPVEGVVWVARQVQAQVDREMLGAEGLWAELIELQQAVDEGRITDEEYLAGEAELMDRLELMESE